jgi:MerR family transcriptional regulator/heat shock protein HspR
LRWHEICIYEYRNSSSILKSPMQHEQPRSTEEHLSPIGEVARKLGISVATLRLYEREGLLIPVRKNSGHRLFSASDVRRLRWIRATINDLKISIEGMKRMLALIPCWRILNCPEDLRETCPAFSATHIPCWMVNDKVWECRTADCRKCVVYQEADCRSLKQTISHYTLTHPADGKGG